MIMDIWRIGICKSCVFSTETDVPSSLVRNYLWCEHHCKLTKENRWCESYIPKRNLRNKPFTALCEYEGKE